MERIIKTASKGTSEEERIRGRKRLKLIGDTKRVGYKGTKAKEATGCGERDLSNHVMTTIRFISRIYTNSSFNKCSSHKINM